MLFTPIVLMTVMGIAVNFLCDHQIPAILKNLCGVNEKNKTKNIIQSFYTSQ
jgi:hypothetical protein